MNPVDAPERRSMARALGPPALLLVIVIAFYWKITLTSQFSWLEGWDLANQVLPWQQVQAAAFHRGQLPLWDPYLWGGQSLIGQAQPGTAYPLNWILYALPLEDGYIRLSFFNWYYALIHFLAALFCYWLCRDLERSRIASIIAGTAFGLAGAVGTTDWPQIVNGMIWAPLVLLFLLRAISGRRPLLSAALSGFFLGISWLSGHHQVPLYFSLGFAGIWLFYVFRRGKPDWSVLRLAAVSAIFLVFTSALQVLPAYQYGHLARRWISLPDPVAWTDVIPYTAHQPHSLGLSTILGLFVPGIHKFADPYVGVIILSLGVLAVALWWSDIRVRILCVFSLAGLFLSLGHQNVFHGLLYGVVPLMDKSREPAMFVVLFNFGIAVLTAYGFDGLRDRGESSWPRRVAVALALAGAVILALILDVMLRMKLVFDFDDRIVLVAVLSLLVAALYFGYHKKNLTSTSLGVSCLLLLLMDLGNSTGYAFPHRQDKERAVFLNKYSENPDLLVWLKRQPGPFRIQIDAKEIPYNYGDWNGLEVWGGYLTSLPSNMVRLGLDSIPTRALYGTKYWVGRAPRDPEQFEVFAAKSGLKVYEDRRALPRLWTVHRALALSSESQILPTFDDTRSLRERAFFLGAAPELDTCSGEDRTKLLQWDFSRVSIQADMQCRGMVVLSDNWYPGWAATVDGRPAKIWEAYTAIRGVEVEPGSHRIEMHYRPLTVLLGAVMLGLSVAGLVVIARFEPAQS